MNVGLMVHDKNMLKRRGSVDSVSSDVEGGPRDDAKRARYGSRHRPDDRHLPHKRASASRPGSVTASSRPEWREASGERQIVQPPVPGMDGLINNYLLTQNSSFSGWKERLYDELKLLKCLFTIEPNAKRKEDIGVDDELKYRNLAKAVILSRVDDEHLRIIENVQDPLKVMKLLSDYRDPRSRHQQAQAEDRLGSLVYEGCGLPMKEFLLMFEQLMNDVERTSGERVNDAEKKEHLLEATISEFPDILTHTKKPADKVTYLELKTLLINESKKNYSKELREQVKEDMRIQNMIDTNPKLAAKETTCTKCGAYGHHVGDCKRLDRCRKCYNCLSFVDDHVASSCPTRQDYHNPRPIKDRSLMPNNNGNSSSRYHAPSSPPPFPIHSASLSKNPIVKMSSKSYMSVPSPVPNFPRREQKVLDSPDMPDSPPTFGGLRKMIHIRRKRTARKLKTGRIPKSDLIFTDSDFYIDVKYTEMFIEEDELRPDDIMLETIQVMKTQ